MSGGKASISSSSLPPSPSPSPEDKVIHTVVPPLEEANSMKFITATGSIGEFMSQPGIPMKWFVFMREERYFRNLGLFFLVYASLFLFVTLISTAIKSEDISSDDMIAIIFLDVFILFVGLVLFFGRVYFSDAFENMKEYPTVTKLTAVTLYFTFGLSGIQLMLSFSCSYCATIFTIVFMIITLAGGVALGFVHWVEMRKLRRMRSPTLVGGTLIGNKVETVY